MCPSGAIERCLFLLFLDNLPVVFFLTIRHCRINTIYVHCRGNIKTVRNSFSEWAIVFFRAYSVSFSASLDMNHLPEKLYLGQNLKQYVMKEAVIYKILRYRQNRCHTNEERWTDHSWHKAKIQHPQQCQSVFTVESTFWYISY
jgi:hypothetical protein